MSTSPTTEAEDLKAQYPESEWQHVTWESKRGRPLPTEESVRRLYHPAELAFIRISGRRASTAYRKAPTKR